MSILGAAMRADTQPPGAGNPLDDKYYDNLDDAGLASSAGVRVAPDNAMSISTVYSCVRVITESLGVLPLFYYQKKKGGGRTLLEEDSLYHLLHDAPNRWQTPMEFKEMLTGHACLRGNGYARKIFADARRTEVAELIPLNPAKMKPKQGNDGFITYKYWTREKGWITYAPDEIFHLRFLTLDGVVGVNPIQLQREALGLAAGAVQFQSRFFRNAARPGGVLVHPGKLSQKARERLRAQWQELYSGSNQFKTAVLEEGLDWKTIGMKLDDAQFLELRQYERSEIAAMWRVPLHKIGIQDKGSYASFEQEAIEFQTDCMLGWVTRWEEVIKRDLVTDDQSYAEFKMDVNMRGDLKTRYDAYAVGKTNGWLTINNILTMENMDPIGPDGDKHQGVDTPAPGVPAPGAPLPPGPQPPGPAPDPRGGKRDPGAPQPKPPRKMGRDDGGFRERVLTDVAARIAHLEDREGRSMSGERLPAYIKGPFREYVTRLVTPLANGNKRELVSQIMAGAFSAESLPDRQAALYLLLEEHVP